MDSTSANAQPAAALSEPAQSNATPRSSSQPRGLSYKFQRLREKLRQAIASGELNGKLPGERALARRFHVNAKTLSKALTDLAAEGLLDRSIGRGTYVKGHRPNPAPSAKRWLLVCDDCPAHLSRANVLRQVHPELESITDISALRPSFLNQFSAVVDLATGTPEEFLRDMVVRNMPVVVVGKETQTYSTNAVRFDCVLAASQLARDLLLGGHRRLAAVEPRKCTTVVNALLQAATRYSPDAIADACYPNDVVAMVESGVTAIVCQCPELAMEVKQQLQTRGISIPGQVSLLAMGSCVDDPPASGYYVTCSDESRAILHLLAENPSTRPATLWLAGRYVDLGTSAPRLPAHDGISGARFNMASA